jgi:hypothetical protein
VEGERGGAGPGLAGAGRVALPAARVLAAHVSGVACQVLGLHFRVRKILSRSISWKTSMWLVSTKFCRSSIQLLYFF